MKPGREHKQQRAMLGSRLIAGLALLAALAATTLAASTAGAAVGATLEIHNRICPVEYAGGDFFGDCHDNAPDPGLPFTISGPETREATTDASGNVVFADLALGTYNVSGGVPGEFADTRVFCSDASDVSVSYPFTYSATGIAIDLTSGVSVVCDWYNIPYDLSGGEDLVGTLEVVKLACEGHTATEIIVFTPLEVAGGLAEAGHDQCYGATASFKIIPYGDASLDPIWFDAAVGVNSLTLPVGDHTLVELKTGAAATFPIEELARTRVYVLNPLPPDNGTTPPPTPVTPAPSNGVTTLPSTGAGTPAADSVGPALALLGAISLLILGTVTLRRRSI